VLYPARIRWVIPVTWVPFGNCSTIGDAASFPTQALVATTRHYR
jgi:hypothetical protein